ncbi:MAG: hypothetical protein R6T92_00775 [Desulfosalsimonadaceae bacterium]
MIKKIISRSYKKYFMFIVVLIASIIILSTLVIAPPPEPHNIEGRVFYSDGSGADNDKKIDGPATVLLLVDNGRAL